MTEIEADGALDESWTRYKLSSGRRKAERLVQNQNGTSVKKRRFSLSLRFEVSFVFLFQISDNL